MDKQDLMDWLNHISDMLGESFADIAKYGAVYPKTMKGILAKQMEFENEMTKAYKKLEEI